MNTMDLKLNREMLSMTRTILDASCEQAVEKDFLLPDYYPDIFRVLKLSLIHISEPTRPY